MNKLYKFILIGVFCCSSLGMALSENKSTLCSPDSTIESIYNHDTLGDFDKAGMFSVTQLECYVRVLKADIEKHEALLQHIVLGWSDRLWSSVTQKLSGLVTAGLGALGYNLFFSSDLWLAPATAIKDFERCSKVPGLIRRVNKGDMDAFHMIRCSELHYSENDIREWERRVERGRPEYEKMLYNRQIMRFIGPAAVIGGAILFGYSIYRSHTVKSARRKSIEAIRRDSVIIQKIKLISV